MARILGLRAEASQFNWAVVEGTRHKPVLIARDTAAAPVDLDEASALSSLRARVLLVIEAKKPDGVVLRAPEFVARGGTNAARARRRLRIEGVLLEASNSCGTKVTI